MKSLDREKAKKALKELLQVLEHLKKSTVFVEGKRDREALLKLGVSDIFTVSGNLRISSSKVHERGVSRVVILTDLDGRGFELAEEAQRELSHYGIKCELESRRQLARILGLKYFEDIDGKLHEFMEEVLKKGE